MKKKILIFMILLTVSFSLLALPVSGEGGEEFWDDFVESIPEGSVDIEKKEDVLSGIGVDTLLSELLSALGEGLGAAFSFFVMLMGTAMLISVSELIGSHSENSMGMHTSVGVGFISSLLIFSGLYPLCLTVGENIKELASFFSSLIPILTGISAAGGNMNTAGVEAFNMNLTLGILTKTTSEFLLPLVFALFSLSLVSGLDGGGISSLAKGIKGVFMWGIGIGSAIIVGAVSMQQIVASAQDGAYLKAAKYAASGMIPVVGSTVSSALGTLTGGLAYLKSAIGTASVVILVTVSLSPLVMLLLYRFALTVSASLLEFMGSGGGVRIYSAFKSALDALIAIYTMSIVVYISEIIIFVKSGVETFG